MSNNNSGNAAAQKGVAVIAAEKAEAERIAAEKAEAERLAAEKAEAERLAAEKAKAASPNNDDDVGVAGAAAGEPAAAAVKPVGPPKRGKVRVLAKSATHAVVTDDVEQWSVPLSAGDPTKAVAPSLATKKNDGKADTATPPKASKAVVVAETGTHRVLDDGVKRWKEEKPVAEEARA